MALSFSFKRGKVQSLTSGVQQSRAQEDFPNAFNSAKDDKVLARTLNKITVSVPQFIFQKTRLLKNQLSRSGRYWLSFYLQ